MSATSAARPARPETAPRLNWRPCRACGREFVGLLRGVCGGPDCESGPPPANHVRSVPGSYPDLSHLKSPCPGCKTRFIGFAYTYPPVRDEAPRYVPEHLFRYELAKLRPGAAHARGWRCLRCTDRIWKRATVQQQLAAAGALVWPKGAGQ